MEKIDGIFNRNSFPECDPKFWNELAVFSDALEERLLIKELGDNRADKIESEDIEMSKKEKDIIDKLIFWRLCSSLKNRYAVVDMLLYKLPQSLEERHMLGELYSGRLFPEEQMKESKEFEIQYREMLQSEREFENSLSIAQKEAFSEIIDNRVITMLHHAKESFVSGFQYAAQMFLSIFTEYKLER